MGLFDVASASADRLEVARRRAESGASERCGAVGNRLEAQASGSLSKARMARLRDGCTRASTQRSELMHRRQVSVGLRHDAKPTGRERVGIVHRRMLRINCSKWQLGGDGQDRSRLAKLDMPSCRLPYAPKRRCNLRFLLLRTIVGQNGSALWSSSSACIARESCSVGPGSHRA
jgi:hypothetical protein